MSLQTAAAPLSETQCTTSFAIPSTATPALSTAQWPLLLKNYDSLLVRTGHYTPIPSGASPLKRDLKEYLKYSHLSLSFSFSLFFSFFSLFSFLFLFFSFLFLSLLYCIR